MRTTYDASASQRPKPAPSSPRSGLLGLLLRPQPLPLGVGIAVATAYIVVEAGSEKSFRALFLLGVLVISAGWRFGLALATTLVSAVVYFYFHLDHGGPIVAHDFLALLVFPPIALLANVLGRQAQVRAAESEERRQKADAVACLARTLAEEQAALRRVATLVARGVAPAEIYPAAIAELSRGLGVDNVALLWMPATCTVRQSCTRVSIFRWRETMWPPRSCSRADRPGWIVMQAQRVRLLSAFGRLACFPP